MSLGTRQYSYSYNPPHLETEDTDQEGRDDSALVINVRCPTLSPGSWCYKLYGLVLAGLGLIISFIWASFVFLHISYYFDEVCKLLLDGR